MIQSIFDQHTEELRHKIAATLAEHLFRELSISDVLKMYDDLVTPSENRGTKPAQPELDYDKFGDRIIQVEYVNAKLGGLQNIGIDLPILFTPAQSLSTLMFVGMEPFRANDIVDKATIGTPFALHQTSQNSSGSRIRTFLHQVLRDNYSIYVTDISKVYAKNGNHKYVGEPVTNQKIFEAELRLIEPSNIFVFGKSALARLKTFYIYDLPVIELAHPAAWGGNKKYYELFTTAMQDYNQADTKVR